MVVLCFFRKDATWQPPGVSKTDGEVVGILMDMSEGRLSTEGQGHTEGQQSNTRVNLRTKIQNKEKESDVNLATISAASTSHSNLIIGGNVIYPVLNQAAQSVQNSQNVQITSDQQQQIVGSTLTNTAQSLVPQDFNLPGQQVLGIPQTINGDQFVLVTVVPEGGGETVIHIYRVHGGLQSQGMEVPEQNITIAHQPAIENNDAANTDSVNASAVEEQGSSVLKAIPMSSLQSLNSQSGEVIQTSIDQLPSEEFTQSSEMMVTDYDKEKQTSLDQSQTGLKTDVVTQPESQITVVVANEADELTKTQSMELDLQESQDTVQSETVSLENQPELTARAINVTIETEDSDNFQESMSIETNKDSCIQDNQNSNTHVADDKIQSSDTTSSDDRNQSSNTTIEETSSTFKNLSESIVEHGDMDVDSVDRIEPTSIGSSSEQTGSLNSREYHHTIDNIINKQGPQDCANSTSPENSNAAGSSNVKEHASVSNHSVEFLIGAKENDSNIVESNIEKVKSTSTLSNNVEIENG